MIAIIDWYSKFIVGYTISNTLQAEMVTRTVREAVSHYEKPEIIKVLNSPRQTILNLLKALKPLKSAWMEETVQRIT